MLLLFLPLLGLASGCGPEGLPRCAAGEEEPLVIRHGRLFDGRGGPVVPDATVVLRGERIAAIGPAAEVELPRCGRLLDARGGLILPGVIDNHVHLRLSLEAGEDLLTPWLRDGVTTLVDTGSERGGVRRLRERVRRISKAPPRLFVAGPIFTAPGGYPATRMDPEVEDAVAEGVRDPAEAESKVLHLLDVEGADLVKAAVERGFFADLPDPGWPVPSPPVLAAIVRAAHARSRTARAHVTQPGELAAALDAGFDATAHTPVAPVPRPLLARAARRGMILTTTVAIWHDPPLTVAVQANLVRYRELGGRIALGTDAPTYQPGGGMPLAELRALVAGGLASRDVLLAATRDGAAALGGRGADLGTLEPGKLADLIVVAGDPLADISALADVTLVIRGGELIVAPPELALEPGRSPGRRDHRRKDVGDLGVSKRRRL